MKRGDTYESCVRCWWFTKHKPRKKCIVKDVWSGIQTSTQNIVFFKSAKIENDKANCSCEQTIKVTPIDIRNELRKKAIIKFINENVQIEDFESYGLKINCNEDLLWEFIETIKIPLKGIKIREVIESYIKNKISVAELIEKLKPYLLVSELK